MRLTKSDLPRAFHKLVRGRKVIVKLIADEEPVRTFGTWWDGGSRSEYCFVDDKGNTRHIALNTGGAFSDLPMSTDMLPRPNEVVMETGTFCGKPATPTFYVPRRMAWKFAGAPIEAIIRKFRTGFQKWTPIGILCDWLKDNDHEPIVERMVKFYGPNIQMDSSIVGAIADMDLETPENAV